MYSLLRFLFIGIYLCCASMLMGQTYKYSGTDMPYDTANITVTPPPSVLVQVSTLRQTCN